MKYPKNCWGVSSCTAYVCLVGCNAFCFKLPAFVKCAEKSFLYLVTGMVFTSAPGVYFDR